MSITAENYIEESEKLGLKELAVAVPKGGDPIATLIAFDGSMGPPIATVVTKEHAEVLAFACDVTPHLLRQNARMKYLLQHVVKQQNDYGRSWAADQCRRELEAFEKGEVLEESLK